MAQTDIGVPSVGAQAEDSIITGLIMTMLGSHK